MRSCEGDVPGLGALFGSHNLLSGLPPEYSARLLEKAPTISLTKGQALFQIGAAGDGCYWLKEGVLKVSMVSNQGVERILAILGPGSIVGELAMIDGLPRSASVQALRDSRLTFVSRNKFRECLRDSPELYASLVDTLVARLPNEGRAGVFGRANLTPRSENQASGDLAVTLPDGCVERRAQCMVALAVRSHKKTAGHLTGTSRPSSCGSHR